MIKGLKTYRVTVNDTAYPLDRHYFFSNLRAARKTYAVLATLPGTVREVFLDRIETLECETAETAKERLTR